MTITTRGMLLLAVVFFALPSSVHATPDYKQDPCIGAWKWQRSAGGLLGAVLTPPPTGWSRVLYLHGDGTYRYWEEDSVSEYLLCAGAFTILNPGSDTTSRYVVLENWPFMPQERITFVGPDIFQMYPGGSELIVSDALTDTFTRERSHPEPTRVDVRRRPARIRTGQSISAFAGYFLDLDDEDRDRIGRGLWEVGDRQYPMSVTQGYTYTNSQIPSAILGDFDGDDSLDYAIQENTEGYATNELLVLLSNHGQRTTKTLLREPMLFDPPGGMNGGRSRIGRPTFYLELLPRGRTFQAASGDAMTLTRDAILVVRPDGSATPYYDADSQWRTGKPLSEPPWNPREPMH